KNKKGEWRFNGYAQDGSSSTNPLFPPDYVSHAISKNSWNQFSKHPSGNKVLFTPTVYDTAQWKPAKKKLIKRLMEENPTMKYKTVNQWMKILSLQTAPEENPKTKKSDGSYGGASFNAYHTNFNYYRSFVLLGNTKK